MEEFLQIGFDIMFSKDILLYLGMKNGERKLDDSEHD